MKSDETKVVEVLSAMSGEKEFRRLSMLLDSKTQHLSFHKEDIEEYKKLLEMGDEIIPFILKDLATYTDYFGADNYNPWYHMMLLHRLTNEHQAPKEDDGNLNKQIKVWVKWGTEKGYLEKEKRFWF